ncbi:MAG: nuclear transport factor 2 family protein [Usitatibacteraceae bacterium]
MIQDEIALRAAEDAFNQAMVSNDPDKIRDCITPNWILVTPERGPVSGEEVLGAIARGVLGHYTMVKQEHLIRVFSDAAFVTGRGQNTGWFRSSPIEADEWITDIYRRIDGKWLCELTHLSPALAPIGQR